MRVVYFKSTFLRVISLYKLKNHGKRPLKNMTILITLQKRMDFSEVTGVRALSFRNLSVGETAGPDMSGQCGGGKTPP
jgi:hypothetical protein